jgi:hypothetical protein
VLGELQGVQRELAGDIEGRVADDVVALEVRLEEVLNGGARIAALDEVGGGRFDPDPAGCFRDGAEPRARIVDLSLEALDLEQALTAPARLHVMLVGLEQAA